MNEVLEINETVTYANKIFVIEIDGFAPELMDGIAFRVIGGSSGARMKDIKCPHCGRHYISVDEDTKVKVFCFPKKAGVACHSYRPCRICHGEVGVRFV